MNDIFGIPNYFIESCLKNFRQEEQLDILQEECTELLQACSAMRRHQDRQSLNQMQREMAHVLMQSAVIAKIMGISHDDILFEVGMKSKEYHFTSDENYDEYHSFRNKF